MLVALKLGRRTAALSFIPIFVFLAFRYDYGNDYRGYLDTFNEIASLATMDYDSQRWHAEIGWLLLNRAFSDLGFFLMIACLAAFNCYVYVRFITKFVQPRYYWLAIFFYLVVPENMLVQSSAMRQAVAISIFLVAIDYIIQRRFFRYFFCIALAGAFHTSALLLLPAYLLGSAKIELKRKYIPLFLMTFVGILVLANELKALLGGVIALVAERYSVYEDDGGVLSSGLGLVFTALNLAIILWFHDGQDFRGRVLMRLALAGILIVPMASALMMLARLAFYFDIVSIAVIPLVAAGIRSLPLRILYVSLNAMFATYKYWQFFQAPVWRDYFTNYSTVFSVPYN